MKGEIWADLGGSDGEAGGSSISLVLCTRGEHVGNGKSRSR